MKAAVQFLDKTICYERCLHVCITRKLALAVSDELHESQIDQSLIEIRTLKQSTSTTSSMQHLFKSKNDTDIQFSTQAVSSLKHSY